MDNYDTMKYLTSAGYSEEKAKKLIRISYEYGVPLIPLSLDGNITEIENAIKKKNSLGQ